MTREERQRQARAAIVMCERIRPRLKVQGDIATIPDDQLARMYDGVELRAAKWLRHVAGLCGRPKRTKTKAVNEAMLLDERM